MIDNCRLSVTDQAGNINNISINIVHVHNYTQEITKTATCTEYGIITYSCACGVTQKIKLYDLMLDNVYSQYSLHCLSY